MGALRGMCVMRMSGASLRLKWEQEQQQLDERSSGCRGERVGGEREGAYTATSIAIFRHFSLFCRIFSVCVCSDAFIKSQQKQSAGVNFGQAGRGREREEQSGRKW